MFGRRTVLASLITALAFVALAVSVYLTWVTWQSGTVAGCTAESLLDCDDVLASRWSKWLGLPVSALGAVTYLLILGLVWPAASKPKGVEVTSLFTAALLAAGAAVWFIGLQAVQLQSFCAYCLTVHCCGLCISGLATWLFLDRSAGSEVDQMRSLLGVDAVDPAAEVGSPGEPISVTRLLVALSVAAVGLMALMGGQLLVEPAEAMAMEEVEFPASTDEPTEPSDGSVVDEPSTANAIVDTTDAPAESGEWLEDDLDLSTDDSAGELVADEPDTIDSIFQSGSRQVSFKALSSAVDVSDMPVLGNPAAPHVLLEMMDYTCKHCRHLHPHLQAAVDRYGDQLCVIIYNIPLSKKCNQYVSKDNPGKKYACDYAQLAIGVWKLAPEKFSDFHHWLLESEKPPSVIKARKRARDLVGNEIFDSELKADASRRLADQATSFSRLKSGLPILLLQNGALRGVPESNEKLFEYLETKLGIEPQ